MKLDRSKPFGKIAGDQFIPDGCDRPAAFEQGGKFFDAHGRLIEPGVAVSIVPDEDDAVVEGDQVMTVAEILLQAQAMPIRKLRAEASRALGPECPNTKAQIIEKLREVQQAFDSRHAKRRGQAQAAAPVSGAGVDLAAWARGQKEYLWGDVRKEIKGRFGRNVSERDDAVEFLITQEVITAGEARQDVLRGE